MTPGERERLAAAAVEAVLKASGEGRLATAAEALDALARDGFFPQDDGRREGGDPGRQALTREEAAEDLPAVLAQDPRLNSFTGISGQTVYHCPDLLSRTYARILDRKGSPLALMAEEIRANSRDYPRPLPLEVFQAAPFDLSPEEMERALRAMAADPSYRDITFTTTPDGAVYLFSTRHLERGHAEFLARQAESIAMNP